MCSVFGETCKRDRVLIDKQSKVRKYEKREITSTPTTLRVNYTLRKIRYVNQIQQ